LPWRIIQLLRKMSCCDFSLSLSYGKTSYIQTARQLALLEEQPDLWVVTDDRGSRSERNRDAAFDRLAGRERNWRRRRGWRWTGIQTPAATSGLLSQSTYDIAGQRLAAGDSIYSCGKICSQNSSGDCSGTGGTVINGGSISAAGNVNAAGTVTAGSLVSNVNVSNLNGTIYNAENTWALQGLDVGWGGNASPQSGVGSAYVNDVYIRSIGKWASQLGNINFAAACYVYVGDGGTCPANSVVVGVGGFYASYTAGYLYCAPVM
jgi:hypothetical protein